MPAPRVLGLRSDIRSAETPKDLSLWHRKKETFYDLYICQNKTLDDVKTIMESDHGFPKTLKISEYEQILREVFKYRKNLSADDWRLSIGPQIARRKAEGKRSKVLLNGSKVQNVDRKIRRSLRSRSSHRHLKAHTAALPYGLIIRTPSPQPSTLAVSPGFGRNHHVNQIRQHERHQSPTDLLSDFPIRRWRFLTLWMIGVTLPHVDAIPTIVSLAHVLMERCPINRLLALLDEYHNNLAERKFNKADLRPFGPNATIGILEKMCFDFSNSLQRKTLSRGEMKTILDWIGFSVDIASLKAFFSQKSLTIRAAWEALDSTVRRRRHWAAFNVLLALHLSIMDQAPWTKPRLGCTLSDCVDIMDPNRMAILLKVYPYDQSELDKALRNAAIKKCSIELVKQLVSAGASLKNSDGETSVDDLIGYSRHGKECETIDLTLLEFLLEAGVVVDEVENGTSNLGWSHPSYPLYATDYMLLGTRSSTHNTNSLWSLVSTYSDRQETTVTVPGIFQAIQSGQEHLRFYLNARLEPSDYEDRKLVLEIALSEASGRGYANVVKGLVQFGVDPNVLALLQLHWDDWLNEGPHVWHPVIRAVNSGCVYTLRILVNAPSIDTALLDGLLDAGLDLCALRNMENSQRDEILRVLSTFDFHTATRLNILLQAITTRCRKFQNSEKCNHNGPDFEFASQLLDLGLACLNHGEDLDGKTPHIILHAIENACSSSALAYLVGRDVEILSSLSAGTIRKLLKAILRRADGTCLEMLDFLAENIKGFQSYIHDGKSYLLIGYPEEVRLWNSSFVRLMGWGMGWHILYMLKLFVDLRIFSCARDTRCSKHHAFLKQVTTYISEDFILTMIHRGADVSEFEDDDWTVVLHQSIELGWLDLAVALVEKGARVNAAPAYEGGRTALQQACGSGAPLWFIRFLVDKGADVNALPAPEEGLTALQAAYNSGAPLSLINFLIDEGANVDAGPAPYGGFTALQAACHHGAPLPLIKFLIEKGADVNAAPAPLYGRTALQCAAARGMRNVVELLLDRGADVNAIGGVREKSGFAEFWRAIDLAAEYSRLDMVHFLIAAGARSHQPGLTGFDGAIAIATREEHFAIALLLQEQTTSRSEDPMEVERRWLLANPQACMYNDSIQPASWVAFRKRTGEDDMADLRAYMEEELGIPTPEPVDHFHDLNDLDEACSSW